MKRLYDDDDLKSYNFKLMSECIYDEFWELLFIYTYDEDSDENNVSVERLLFVSEDNSFIHTCYSLGIQSKKKNKPFFF